MSEISALPVLETDFLKAIIDPNDRLHKSSMKVLEKVKSMEWYIASSALIQLDLLLKISGIPVDDRSLIFETLRSELPKETIIPIIHEPMSQAIQLQKKYHKIKRSYFDSIHLSIAIGVDGQIVSSDYSFDRVTEIERLPLEQL